MSAHPLWRLLPSFGATLLKQRMARNLGADALATAADVPIHELTLMERGHLSPTLPEFFRLARALGKDPSILLIHLISEWHAETVLASLSVVYEFLI
jgi:transcriptional regulator with XRE-family HTH domain